MIMAESWTYVSVPRVIFQYAHKDLGHARFLIGSSNRSIYS